MSFKLLDIAKIRLIVEYQRMLCEKAPLVIKNGRIYRISSELFPAIRPMRVGVWSYRKKFSGAESLVVYQSIMSKPQ